jgi:hypothetical protein
MIGLQIFNGFSKFFFDWRLAFGCSAFGLRPFGVCPSGV